MNALLRAAAEAVCEAFNQDPKGSRNRLRAGKWEEEMFLDANAKAARAVLKKVREGIDSVPADYHGDVNKQKLLDWLDEAARE